MLPSMLPPLLQCLMQKRRKVRQNMVKTPTTTTIPSLKAGGGGVYPLSRLLGVGGGVFCGACIFY